MNIIECLLFNCQNKHIEYGNSRSINSANKEYRSGLLVSFMLIMMAYENRLNYEEFKKSARIKTLLREN